MDELVQRDRVTSIKLNFIFVRFKCEDFSYLRCGWFTYFPEEGFCQLLSNCTRVEARSCPNCLGGSSDCKLISTQDCIKGQCQGNLLKSEQISTMQECQQLCKSTEGCKWVTFNSGPKPMCLLLRSCIMLDESCTNCFSGGPRCETGEGGALIEPSLV